MWNESLCEEANGEAVKKEREREGEGGYEGRLFRASLRLKDVGMDQVIHTTCIRDID